ncbi:MAG: EpsI family protein [Bryobacteraceae bacterium]|nr:EpsI family protein [Bryobacteraceae bacterium]
MENSFSFLRERKTLILTVVLLLQAAAVYGYKREELIPKHIQLSEFVHTVGSWVMQQEHPMDEATAAVLKADDTLNRSYVDPVTGKSANLFVAFFRSQRTGQAPHSPKNCLPGSGWVPSVADIVNLDVPGRGALEVNRYVIQKGDARSLVLYWYQSRDRVVASEYTAKFYVVADALRYNRTDTALVRVVVPIPPRTSVEEAQKSAVQFVQTFYQPLRRHFPA